MTWCLGMVCSYANRLTCGRATRPLVERLNYGQGSTLYLWTNYRTCVATECWDTLGSSAGNSASVQTYKSLGLKAVPVSVYPTHRGKTNSFL
jgi:hypothetical protein